MDNLAALAWNIGERPVLFKGTPLKSVNQYCNKQMAKRRSICERMNGRHSSKRIARLTAKRNRKVEDYLHKASRKVIDLCAEQDVSVLVIGKNKGWKHNGAYQIMRKVFPNVNADGIEGVALRPAVVALSMNVRRGSGCA
ncbi:transposase [Mitsuokella jalaludinii]|uniref:transposase n=1 Tax=Mitsuokella jalaludinii TaxID=187979 RepID=UPI00307B4AAB